MLLNVFALSPSVVAFQFSGKTHEVTLVEMVIGILIVFFAVLGMLPPFRRLAFDRKYLPLGGVISGFFGGLSGLQGAMRSAFLIKAGLDKESFIGTSAVSAVVVDVARLIVYGLSFYTTKFAGISYQIRDLVLAATLAAFVGAFIGARLMKKVTLCTVQIIVGILLIVVGLGMASGMI
jgi:uncharacterized membrane protein YfcA